MIKILLQTAWIWMPVIVFLAVFILTRKNQKQ